MVWWFTSTRHNLAITPWVRSWLRASLADRFILTIFTIGLPWWTFWLIVSLMFRSPGPILALGWLPWLFWIGDAAADHFHTNGDLQKFMRRTSVVLATRAEYVGGHPQLPHGRFAYLLLRGDREQPVLTIQYPHPVGDPDTFDIRLLDVSELSPKTERADSLTGQVMDSFAPRLTQQAGRLLSGEKVTLTVTYQDLAGRKYSVELTSFFRGNDEIRNWRNYLICAQAEADAAATPFGPWKSLQPAPRREEVADDASWNGSKVRPIRRAFERR